MEKASDKATVLSDTNTLIGSDKQKTSVSLRSDRMSGGFLSTPDSLMNGSGNVRDRPIF